VANLSHIHGRVSVPYFAPSSLPANLPSSPFETHIFQYFSGNPGTLTPIKAARVVKQFRDSVTGLYQNCAAVEEAASRRVAEGAPTSFTFSSALGTSLRVPNVSFKNDQHRAEHHAIMCFAELLNLPCFLSAPGVPPSVQVSMKHTTMTKTTELELQFAYLETLSCCPQQAEFRYKIYFDIFVHSFRAMKVCVCSCCVLLLY
jgi:hypothetical protein